MSAAEDRTVTVVVTLPAEVAEAARPFGSVERYVLDAVLRQLVADGYPARRPEREREAE